MSILLNNKQDISPKKNDFVIKFSMWSILLITIASIFVPLSPAMPSGGLDPSWQFALNQAVAQGFQFGKQIIYTFGPYASIYTKEYHPSTDFIMLMGSLYLVASYAFCCSILMRRLKWPWQLTLFTALFASIYSRDALLFSLPLIVGLATFKIITTNNELRDNKKLIPLSIAIIFMGLGFLPLIKGTMLVLCTLTTFICALYCFIKKQKILAIICTMSPAISMPLFWVAAGQPIDNLATYFSSMLNVISGYSEALAVDGDIKEIIAYGVTSILIFLAIFFQNKIDLISKFFLAIVYFLFLFIAFKGGFTRHDTHTIIASTSLLIGALLLPIFLNGRSIFPVIIIAFISWNYINHSYFRTSMVDIGRNIGLTYFSAWEGARQRIINPDWLNVQFDAAVKKIRVEASFPLVQGTSDIYSYDQSYLIASGNLWSPRPIFQSYMAYSAKFAELNKDYLLSSKAPENIFFKVDLIDGRMPSLDDGVSWPVIIQNYQPLEIKNNFLVFRKKPITNKPEFINVKKMERSFGEKINLPNSPNQLFAKLEFAPTIAGRLMSILFKPSQLFITLNLKNGSKKEFRIISDMAKSGFLISPLIENTLEFGMLYGKPEFLSEKMVESFSVSSHYDGIKSWSGKYTATLSEIKPVSKINVSEIYKSEFSDFDDELLNINVQTSEKCNGVIDMVNDKPPRSAGIVIANLLRVNGWLADSIEKATLPEAVYITLTDENGKRRYLNTRRILRADVGSHFKDSRLNNSGYSMVANVSSLRGNYSLGLAIKTLGKTMTCPQFHLPVTFSR
ncbi:hypothetical protein QN379_13960 [Glaciimonas sp. Gout2]|uniref:hypothetical protein n=1 Tax=unclassified Glaciimonas TaxID=2644401 RepID=UPI002B236C55|nr:MULTISPECIES: hypothetical protein [unclassified Glaciimonas]MEB0013781.1 hypothetical protein [Glaciimonas sp. Cout2]MEB0083116.1 hypothetical protein [Glaciimonas sp. Gout2]